MVKLFRKAASISLLTLASRVLGVLRDALIAFVFGASMASDLFFAVFRPFDLLRKMVSEGVLTTSFIPVFSGYLARDMKNHAVSMFYSTLVLVSVFSAAAVSLGIYAAPLVIGALAPGYAGDTYALALGAVLLKVMLPYMFCILGVALSMGVLNALGNFHIPAATPVFFNLMIIGVTLFLADWFHPPVLVLAAGVTLGGLVQLCIQVPCLYRLKMFTRQRVVLFHPGVVKAGKALLPSMVGAAAFQVNVLVAGVMASTLVPGSISFLYYAERLVQFPLALFVTSASTVFLPLLSGRAATRSLGDVYPAFEAGVRLVFFLTIPAMAGIMALNRPIVAFLFERGAFDAHAVAQTGDCLFFLVAGLWAVAGTRLFVTFHYALANIWLPFAAGAIAIGANLILARFLAPAMGISGLALSIAVSSALGFFFLVIRSRVEFSIRGLWVCACRAFFISGIMALLVRWLGTLWISGDGLAQGIGLFATIAAGAVFFFTASAFLGGTEIKALKRMVFKRE
ncbi:MAG: murein biosynthesis integral membrane protein MurJ [Desulfobacter sp.]